MKLNITTWKKHFFRNKLSLAFANSRLLLSCETILETLPNFIFWKDKEGIYLGCNQNFVHILGYQSKQEIIGQSDRDLGFHKLEADFCEEGDRTVLNGEPILNREESLIRKNKKPIIMLISKVPLLDEYNKVAGILGIATDITYRKTKEQKFLENIIALMPGYVFWKDRQSIYLGCNDNLAKDSGLGHREALIGRTDQELPWGEKAETFRQDDLRIIQTGISMLSLEEELPRADGSIATVLTNKVPLRDEDGKITGVLAISSDISERKHIEEDLKIAKEKAEAANQAKSDFLAIASHELRIPLTGVLGAVGFLRNKDLQPDDQNQYINIIDQSGKHLLSIINDILNFAKLEAGKFELSPAPLNLKELVEDATIMLVAAAKAKGLELLINYSADVPCRIIADGRALRQVIINLVNNAIKFTPEGQITVSVEVSKEQSGAEDNVCLDISVTDTGVGIPVGKLNAVFERFEQVDTSRTRRYGGTGLGLSIVKKIIELMNGTVTVKSTEGKGSCFTCTLNFIKHIAAELEQPWDEYRAMTRTLIVDDTSRGKIICRQVGITNSMFVSSPHALSTLITANSMQEPYDIILIDDQLTSINHIELLHQIQQQTNLLQPLPILLSYLNTLADQKQLRDAGFFKIITKPTQPLALQTQLTAAWEEWVERQETKNKAGGKDVTKRRSHINNNDRYKVLLVEDDRIVQFIHASILKSLACQVDIAETGAQALQKWDSHYNIIFMDIGLPDISGINVIEKIRSSENDDAKVPIVCLTGFDSTEEAERCITAGADYVAVKPISQHDLNEIVERYAS